MEPFDYLECIEVSIQKANRTLIDSNSPKNSIPKLKQIHFPPADIQIKS